jgi:hypothetical protein
MVDTIGLIVTVILSIFTVIFTVSLTHWYSIRTKYRTTVLLIRNKLEYILKNKIILLEGSHVGRNLGYELAKETSEEITMLESYHQKIENEDVWKIANTLKSYFHVLAGIIHNTPSDKLHELQDLWNKIFDCSRALNLFLKSLV